jgi:hypothetical protein
MPAGEGRGLRPVRARGLSENPLHVVRGGVLADRERRRDLTIRQARRDKSQDLRFTL